MEGAEKGLQDGAVTGGYIIRQAAKFLAPLGLESTPQETKYVSRSVTVTGAPMVVQVSFLASLVCQGQLLVEGAIGLVREVRHQ